MMNELFYELIQVAIGTQDCLSHTPTADEWGKLYKSAKKQSLVGVCFAALQRLGADADEGFARIGMSEMMYLTWMGMTAKIQQKNQTVDEQCVILGERLKAEGYSYAILKGQGVASLYSEHLLGLRQSGDIDALLWKDGLNLKENREAVMQLARSIDKDAAGSEHHVHAHFFEDTEVELHYEPSYFCNPWANRRFRNWCEEHRKDMVWCDALGCMMPNAEYNVVFLLSHMFRHYMSEGVGLRQLMDYYFVLRQFQDGSKFQEVLKLDKKACGEKAVLTKTEKKTDPVSSGSANLTNANLSSVIENKLSSSAAKSSLDANGTEEPASVKNNKNICSVLKSLNMLKFAGAVMFVMKEVFGMDEQFMICEPDERLGRKLLAHVMLGGNFGHHNTETVASKKSHVGRFINQVAQDLSLSVDYPAEALWAPISMIREFLRIRI